MSRKIAKMTSRSVSDACDCFRNDNPLLVRKKFSMKDVFFRRDQPDVELFRWELAFDVELYVILIVLLAGCVCLFSKIVHGLERRRIRRLEKMCSIQKQKS